MPKLFKNIGLILYDSTTFIVIWRFRWPTFIQQIYWYIQCQSTRTCI